MPGLKARQLPAARKGFRSPRTPRAAMRKAAGSRHVWSKSVKRQVLKGGGSDVYERSMYALGVIIFREKGRSRTERRSRSPVTR